MMNRVHTNKDVSTTRRVAIIGAGVSGLSSAYHLHEDHDVTVFEKADYVGGHTDTHHFEIDGNEVRVDSGFIIFCPQYYPHFSTMLENLGVESQPTDMSFSARNDDTGLLYNSTNPNKLFCDRRNLFRPRFWRMIYDILRFYRQSTEVLEDNYSRSESVSEYLNANNYSRSFKHDHLLPMISALWSTNTTQVEKFPIRHLVDFFSRHGLMKIIGRPQWKVIKNGSSSYVEALLSHLKCNFLIGDAVTRVERTDNDVKIHTDSGGMYEFDAVILATHADVSLALLDNPTEAEADILGSILFERNHVVVHTDESIMSTNRQSWASWNTEVPTVGNENSLNCCTANYWMNSLQRLPISTNVFTTLNGYKKISRASILTERHYSHPIFTAKSVSAQSRLPEINGGQNTYYVGAYWGWGFHEDGAKSAFESCKRLRKDFEKRTFEQRGLSDD
ncbi:FAD-dependent oxidoreductase [Arenicella sp. 4NH20-0111]|uniref:NAD(P)/FAD-dependent oxidoreductase n=1 Tax=Arenicella sp. 4NH20-0111 TaxID=3127648 RepID=UPI0031057CD1